MEIVEVVIVGAGIAGLTTSLGLHRFGIPNLVLESSDRLRVTGLAFTTWENAWKALEAVGISDTLRRQHQDIHKMVMESTALNQQTSELSFKGHEVRCVQRRLLLEALAAEIPSDTIRFSSKVVSIEDSGHFKQLHLANGVTIMTKVLIGCDGINSMVAKWLGFKKPVFTGRSALRGCADFKNGHRFKQEFRQFVGKGFRSGFLPCDDHLVYWFLTFCPSSPEEGQDKDPVKIKEFVLNKLGDTYKPEDLKTVIDNTHQDSFAPVVALRYRHPWDLILGNISKGNVCIAGDALHPMTPDIGQGGCAALEDAVVLSRCLAEALLKPGTEINNKLDFGHEHEQDYKQIEMALKKYANLRRWRSFDLIATAYMVGFIQQSNGKIISFFRDRFLAKFLLSLYLKKASFDCGKLNK